MELTAVTIASWSPTSLIACPNFLDGQSPLDTFLFRPPLFAFLHNPWPLHYYCQLPTWVAALRPCQHSHTCTDALQVIFIHGRDDRLCECISNVRMIYN